MCSDTVTACTKLFCMPPLSKDRCQRSGVRGAAPKLEGIPEFLLKGMSAGTLLCLSLGSELLLSNVISVQLSHLL